MYITCQQEMDFGEAHNNAMNRRLNKYFLKSLPHVEQEANQWLQEHAEMRAVLTSMLEIKSNKLRLVHENQGTLRQQEALIERKLGTKLS